MLQRSDIQGKTRIQILILRAWEENQLQLLTDLGGIDGGQRNEERIRLIEETIASLRPAPQDYQPSHGSDELDPFALISDEHRQAGLPLFEPCPVNQYEFCDRFI